MAETRPLHGLLAEFREPEELLDAALRVRDAGYRRFDTYSPFPVDGIEQAVRFGDRRVPWLGLIGGVVGFAIGLLLQWFVNIDYPINVGGRPLMAIIAFMLVVFELTILLSVLFMVVGMIVLNGLPRLHHPLDEIDRFKLASMDRFFLCIEASDPKFDFEQTRLFLDGLGARHVDEVPR